MPFLCERCGEAVPNADYVYEGAVVCGECYEEIHDIDTMLLFIKDHPKMLMDYLEETLYAPAPYGTRAKELIEDAAHWSDTCVNPDDHEYMRFSDWVMRWY